MKRGRFHTRFAAQERRKLEQKPATTYVAAHDVLAEMRALAHDLQHPATPLDQEARTICRIHAGLRLEQLLATIEPKPPDPCESSRMTERRANITPVNCAFPPR